jgi:hypothetical protein
MNVGLALQYLGKVYSVELEEKPTICDHMLSHRWTDRISKQRILFCFSYWSNQNGREHFLYKNKF